MFVGDSITTIVCRAIVHENNKKLRRGLGKETELAWFSGKNIFLNRYACNGLQLFEFVKKQQSTKNGKCQRGCWIGFLFIGS
jgi:hypothetical protein